MPFNTESNLVPRADAVKKITEMAIAEGLKGAFKVLYDGTIVADPSNLPANVDMNLVKVSAVMDQA